MAKKSQVSARLVPALKIFDGDTVTFPIRRAAINTDNRELADPRQPMFERGHQNDSCRQKGPEITEIGFFLCRVVVGVAEE
jgi:hypothetical protein